MAELKTKPTDEKVEAFLNRIADEEKRRDAFTIVELMSKASGAEPRMWGPVIVGFGDIHLKYPSGRELDWFKIGFSPRKQDLTLYLNHGALKNTELLEKLGKYKTGKGCLYLRRLSDVDLLILKELISRAVDGGSRE